MRWKFTSARPGSQSAFTLIEVISVLIILGILAAVAIPRIGSLSTYKQYGEYNKVKNHLRYARNRAMKTTSEWSIRFDGQTYALQNEDGSTFRLPGEENENVSLSALSFQDPPESISFDELGVVSMTVDITISTSYKPITITGLTGFIP